MAPYTNKSPLGCVSASPRTPVQHQNFLPQQGPNTVVWDFTPFLSAPAVVARAAERGSDQEVNLLAIPRSGLQSPLNNNITPNDILNIKENLVGSKGETRCGGNGKEIWLSWKRAWDVWNNHYIVGRINPVWIRKEWGEREARMKEWNRGRGQRNRERRKKAAIAAGKKPQQPGYNPLRPESQFPKLKPSLARDPAGPLPFGSGGASEEEDTVMPDSFSSSQFSLPYEDDSEPSNSQPPPQEPAADGSSGGYRPLKMIEEYYEIEEEVNLDGKVWVDAITNTIWTPRRVCEKDLKISLDDDIEDFYENSEFKVDGGLDSSRSPVPVLRSSTEYVRTKDGAFRKKKTWDGVTGTIINIPTQALVPCTETADEKKQRIKDMYFDPIRDNPRGKDTKIFPLDIRRILKVRPDLYVPMDVCEEGESRVRDPALYPDSKVRAMHPQDPYFVTPEQKQARDANSRGQPPKQVEFSGEHLILEDDLWKEEQHRDRDLDAGYFVTNLHGGTLIINGMEIKKGDVAGPLPDFAVIECPGSQVAFWWGAQGRKYGERHRTALSDYSAKWGILRKMEGWANVAEPAGEVWDSIMAERREREKTGETYNDDDLWKSWKTAEKATPKTLGRTKEVRQPGRYGPIPHFTPDDGTEELKWLLVQSEEKKDMLAVSNQPSRLNIPKGKSFWPGKALSPAPRPTRDFMADEKTTLWNSSKAKQLALQLAVKTKIEERLADAHQQMIQQELSHKRKPSEDLQNASKRRKEEQVAAALAATQREAEAQKEALEKRLRDLAEDEYDRFLNMTKTGMSETEALAIIEAARKKRLQKQWTQHSTPAPLPLSKRSHAVPPVTEERREKFRQNAWLPQTPPPMTEDKDKSRRNAALQGIATLNAWAVSHAPAGQPLPPQTATHKHMQQHPAQHSPAPKPDQTAVKILAVKRFEERREATSERKARDGQQARFARDATAKRKSSEERQAKEKEATVERKAREAVSRIGKELEANLQQQAVVKLVGFDKRWAAHLSTFRKQREGTQGQRTAAKSLLEYHKLASKHNKADYEAWQSSLSDSDIAAQMSAMDGASRVLGQSVLPNPPPEPGRTDPAPGRTQPTLILRTNRPQPRLELTPLTPKTLSPPSTMSPSLLQAFGNLEPSELQYQQAVYLSLQAQARDAKAALQLRARSQGMTVASYVLSQGFLTEEEYLEDQKKKDGGGSPQRPIARPKGSLTSELQKDVAHRAKYRAEMRAAIEEGIRENMKHARFPNKGQAALPAAVEARLAMENVESWNLPSRKSVQSMNDQERAEFNDAWAVWCDRLNEARGWRQRVNRLPKGPNWSPVLHKDGKRFASV